MKQIFITLATVLFGILTSPNAKAQTLNEGAMLMVEASSVVLFSEDSADKGAENPMGNLAVIAGYRISPYFAAGLGFGFDLESKSDSKSISGTGIYNEALTSTVSTPLFIHLRSDLMPDAKFCPFIAAEVGYKATLSRADDDQKVLFYENKANIQDVVYSRFYNAGAFGALTAGVGVDFNGHRLNIGLSYVSYNRKNTVMNITNGNQTYKTTDAAKNGISVKLGFSF